MFSFERAKTKGRKKQRREKGDPFSFSHCILTLELKSWKWGKEKCKCRRTVKRQEDEERRKDVSLYTCRTLFTRLENSLFDRRPRHNDGEHKRENGDTLCSCSIRETIIGGNRENGVSRRLQHGVKTYLMIFSRFSIVIISFSRFMLYDRLCTWAD